MHFARGSQAIKFPLGDGDYRYRTNSITTSNNGQYVIVTGHKEYGFTKYNVILTSNDYGETWTCTHKAVNYEYTTSVAMSSDGGIAFVGEWNEDSNDGIVKKSKDYGQSWTTVKTLPQYYKPIEIAISADGTTVFVAALDTYDESNSELWTSNDIGNSWCYKPHKFMKSYPKSIATAGEDGSILFLIMSTNELIKVVNPNTVTATISKTTMEGCSFDTVYTSSNSQIVFIRTKYKGEMILIGSGDEGKSWKRIGVSVQSL